MPNSAERRKKHELREAIDLVVTGTDPRIRSVSNYGRRLAPAMEQMLGHFAACGGWLAAPVEMSTHAWSAAPLVHTLFPNSDALHELMGRNGELRTFFAEHPEADQVFVALSATRQEHRSLGMGLQGDLLQRDIPQTALGFRDFRVFGASGSETELRANVAYRGFGFLIGEALDHIVERHVRQHGAEDAARILALQLKALEHKKRAADALFDASCALDEKIKQLREQVLRQRSVITQTPPTQATLEDYIEQIIAVLAHPEQYITQERITLHVDRMSIEHESATGDTAPIELSEVTIGQRPPRVVVLARYPRSELPVQVDRMTGAEYLLNLPPR